MEIKIQIIKGLSKFLILNEVLGGVDNLEKMTQTRNYSQAAGLLQGVTNVIEHLELYSDSVEEIRSLSERMAKIRRDLASHVTADFNEAFSSSSKVRVKMSFLENLIKFGAFGKS